MYSILFSKLVVNPDDRSILSGYGFHPWCPDGRSGGRRDRIGIGS